ncbi:hypothetical protein D3C73_680150 [compost metagenome]
MALADELITPAQLRGEHRQQPGADQGREEQWRHEQGRRAPTRCGHCRQLPGSAGYIDRCGQRLALEQLRITCDHCALGTFAIPAAQCQAQTAGGVQPPGVKQPIHVSDHRCAAPVHLLPIGISDEDGATMDQRLAALHQCDRASQHRRLAFAGEFKGRILVCNGPVIQAQDLLIAGDWKYPADDVIGGEGEVMNVGLGLDRLLRHAVEMRGSDGAVQAEQLSDTRRHIECRANLALQSSLDSGQLHQGLGGCFLCLFVHVHGAQGDRNDDTAQKNTGWQYKGTPPTVLLGCQAISAVRGRGGSCCVQRVVP